jgi:hypothetical protein
LSTEGTPTPVHDYFDILGVSPGARAAEILRARRRRAGASHPDVQDGPTPGPAVVSDTTPPHPGDVAVDFVDMTAIVARMRSAFFARP